MVVWAFALWCRERLREKWRWGRTCVKNTFVANGRLAGPCTPSLRTMPVVMAATSHLFPWEQRSKSSLTESCRCLNLPPGKKKKREKDWQSKGRKTGGKCRRKLVFPLQVCEWPGKGPCCVYASCYIDAFLLRSFLMCCVRINCNYAALWAKCSRTSQIWALMSLYAY